MHADAEVPGLTPPANPACVAAGAPEAAVPGPSPAASPGRVAADDPVAASARLDVFTPEFAEEMATCDVPSLSRDQGTYIPADVGLFSIVVCGVKYIPATWEDVKRFLTVLARMYVPYDSLADVYWPGGAVTSLKTIVS